MIRLINVYHLLKELSLPPLPQDLEDALVRLRDQNTTYCQQYHDLLNDIVYEEETKSWVRLYLND